MKYSVSSYSYSKLVSSGEYTETGLISLAKEMGFDGIEFAEIHAPEGMDKKEYASLLRAEAQKHEIEIVAYCIGANLIYDSEQEIERLKAEVDVCECLGAPVMRHDASGGYGKADKKRGMGFNNALPLIIAGFTLTILEFGLYKKPYDLFQHRHIRLTRGMPTDCTAHILRDAEFCVHELCTRHRMQKLRHLALSVTDYNIMFLA